LEADVKAKWERELEEHEKAHPQLIIRKLDGSPVGENYKPHTQKIDETDLNEA
jgi:hypothetical protein